MKRPQRTPQRNPQALFLIDGYNLMFESIKFPDRRDGAQALQKARDYFLKHISDRLNLEVRLRTCIVFDSQSDLLLPSELVVHDMQIYYSVGYNSADELIDLLIEQHTAPKQLTVVSSDHQVQKKAKTRGAVALDSEDWVEQYLSILPIRTRDESTGGKSNSRKRSNSRTNALERIKKEKFELGLSPDFEEQLDRLLDSAESDEMRDGEEGQT